MPGRVLRASLVSTHYMPVTTPTQVTTTQMSPDNAKLPLLLVVVVMMEGRQANSPPHMTLKWPTNQRMDNDLRRCLYVCFSVGCEL